jgi:hypothetical protein
MVPEPVGQHGLLATDLHVDHSDYGERRQKDEPVGGYEGLGNDQGEGPQVDGVPDVPVPLYRIKMEEKVLVSRFGREYTEYARRTKKLIPYLY